MSVVLVTGPWLAGVSAVAAALRGDVLAALPSQAGNSLAFISTIKLSNPSPPTAASRCSAV